MEILQNSILKLIVRQGSDSDRKTIVLDSGEFGYTTDTNRVYIGDGFLSGGNVVGNLFKGSAATITDVTLWPSVIGDTAFASDSNKLYALQSGIGNSLSDWLLIGGVYTSGSPNITISSDNVITFTGLSSNSIDSSAVSSPITINAGKIALSPLSANHVSSDLLNYPLTLSSGRITLSPLSSYSVSTEALSSPLTIVNGKIALLPLSAGNFSSNSVSAPLYISNGKIALSAINTGLLPNITTVIGQGLNVTVDGVPSNETPYNPFSANIWLETRQIFAKYNGLSGGLIDYSRDVSGVTRLSAGDYSFFFIPTIENEYIPMVQIFGEDALAYQPRVISTTLSSCHVKILNDSGVTADANIYLLINY